MDMIAQDEAAISLFEAAGGRGFRREPVVLRIILLQVRGRGLRRELHQTALLALDQLKLARGGSIETIGSREQELELGTVAGRAVAAHEWPLAVDWLLSARREILLPRIRSRVSEF